MTDAKRRQLHAELAHWQGAIVQLAELDAVAPADAWSHLEDYLRLRLRDRLTSSIAALSAEGTTLATALASGRPLGECRASLLRLRARYLAVESTVEFFGDAVQQRTTPRLGAVLRGLDTIAVDSMEVVLRPLGKDVPPALVYPEKGLGAAVLRAGIRLWDQGGLSPVAAIKVTRHNLIHPTAILHETPAALATSPTGRSFGAGPIRITQSSSRQSPRIKRAESRTSSAAAAPSIVSARLRSIAAQSPG